MPPSLENWLWTILILFLIYVMAVITDDPQPKEYVNSCPMRQHRASNNSTKHRTAIRFFIELLNAKYRKGINMSSNFIWALPYPHPRGSVHMRLFWIKKSHFPAIAVRKWESEHRNISATKCSALIIPRRPCWRIASSRWEPTAIS